MRTVSLATYLFTRLRQNNVHHVHGLPGDYTLRALDYLKAAGLKWINNCNELNAGYAADGYSRVRGLGALFTTYGVGELSAINAVAGSFAEHVPVVHVVGTPPRRLQAAGAHCHHTLGDGRSRIYAEIYEKVTVAQANLTCQQKAPQLVDETIRKCILQSRPVYIELPSDMVSAPVSRDRLEDMIEVDAPANEKEVDSQVEFLLQRLYNAKNPMLLVDCGDGMRYLKPEINELVRCSRIPTLTMPSGAGMVDHSLDSYFGVHAGPVGQIDTMPFVRSTDLVLTFGPQFSDTQTLGWSVVPDATKMVTIGRNRIGTIDVDAKRVLQLLVQRLDVSKISRGDVSSLGDFRSIKAARTDPENPIDQDSLYLKLNDYLQPDDVIILANATPILGGRDFILPPRAQAIVSGMWFSIGHMLPAAQGVALSHRKGRTILFEGDGSFQTTAQELSTIIRERLDVVIFLVNNGGYAYERQIHGMNEDYNDLAPWRYLEAPRFFGASESYDDGYTVKTYQIRTWGDLDRLLAMDDFHEKRGLKFVEVIVGKYDIPEKFKEVFRRAGNEL